MGGEIEGVEEGVGGREEGGDFVRGEVVWDEEEAVFVERGELLGGEAVHGCKLEAVQE